MHVLMYSYTYACMHVGRGWNRNRDLPPNLANTIYTRRGLGSPAVDLILQNHSGNAPDVETGTGKQGPRIGGPRMMAGSALLAVCVFWCFVRGCVEAGE